MSAIAGILCFDGAPVVPGRVERLANAMRRRGPDAQATWSNGSVTLGHCLLGTTTESPGERQPLASADGRLVMTWDGRLDNRRELRLRLRGANVVPRDDTDPELVLCAYLAWGEDCPRDLLGDFAFAVWDGARQVLFCARDPVGARPFFYFTDDCLFAFASEDEALLTLPCVSNRPNADRLAAALCLPFSRCCDPLQSWLDDVRRLAPGHSISVDADGAVRHRSYYEAGESAELKFRSEEECREAFLDVFSRAVKCRLRATRPPELMMSGGLDSTAIAAMMRLISPEQRGESIRVYSVVADEVDSCIESSSIEDVIERLGLTANRVSVPSMSGMADIEDLVHAFRDRPHPVSHSILMTALISLVASRQGDRVLLHGVSGDLALDVPDDYFFRQLLNGEWRRGVRECRATSRNHTYLRGQSPLYLMLKSGWGHFAPLRVRRLFRRSIGSAQSDPIADSIIDPTFAAEIDLVERLRDEQARGLAKRQNSVRQVQLESLFPTGLMIGLEGYDRVAGNHGLEMRDPWADVRVVSFLANLPLRFKIRDGWTKYLVRSTFADQLGARVVGRKDKQHVGWQLVNALVERCRGEFDEALRNMPDSLGRSVGSNDLYDRLERNRKGVSYEDALICYRVASLAMWLNRLSVETLVKRGENIRE